MAINYGKGNNDLDYDLSMLQIWKFYSVDNDSKIVDPILTRSRAWLHDQVSCYLMLYWKMVSQCLMNVTRIMICLQS